MPVLTVYRHGVTAGCPPDKPPKPPERTKCHGWSVSAIRRNRLFLYSVDETRLDDGIGFAFTGTVRTCPDTHIEWKKGREAFFDRLRRSGLIRAHWVTEWQRRGIPHLHMAVWFPHAEVARWVSHAAFGRWIILQWMESVGDHHAARDSGQHVTPIFDVVGWNQYVSKHAARGLSHYQRNPANIPQGWRDVGTGRMWGTLGDWPTIDPAQADLSMPEFWIMRRIIRRYRCAQARTELARSLAAVNHASTPQRAALAHKHKRTALRRIVQARGMLKARIKPDDLNIPIAEASRRLSSVRGLSEWIPEREQIRMLSILSR